MDDINALTLKDFTDWLCGRECPKLLEEWSRVSTFTLCKFETEELRLESRFTRWKCTYPSIYTYLPHLPKNVIFKGRNT